MTNKLLITFGCSWTFGVGAAYSPDMNEEQYLDIAWNEELNKPFLFRTLISEKYKFDNKNFSAAGSSNQKQFRLAKEYFSSNEFDKDKQKYDKIIVLWGITSIYRNELYLNSQESLVNFFYNQNRNEKFVDTYFKNTFDETDTIRNLALDILTFDKFFEGHSVDNYWFDTFNHVNYENPYLGFEYHEWKNDYYKNAGKDWPSWEDFLNDNLDHINTTIYKEIHDQSRWLHAHFKVRYRNNKPTFKKILDFDKQYRDLANYLALANGNVNGEKTTHKSDFSCDADRIAYLSRIGLVNPFSFHPTKEGHRQIAKYFETKINFA